MSKSKIKIQPIHFDDFYEQMERESDRGCILIGCQILDVALEHKLRSHLSRRRHVVANAVNPLFRSMGPLSSFWAKIRFAYAIGIINKWVFDDLDIFRDIRNISAHSHGTFSFEASEVGSLLSRLQSTRIAMGDPGRAWSLDRTYKICTKLAAEWRKKNKYRKSVKHLYFVMGFHFLHGYITQGVAYRKIKK